MKPLERTYWCFISYRHVDNRDVGRQWASWLHQQLETYEVPEDLVGITNEWGDVISSRIFPVFRDEVELELGNLNEKIYRALDHSKALIVICSPRVLDSRYVDDEIRYFKLIGKANRIYVALIEGEPSAQTGSNGCFPETLGYEIDDHGNILKTRRTEPMAADFRLNDGSQGWTNAEAYREDLTEAHTLTKSDVTKLVGSYQDRLDTSRLKLIAAVLGVPFGTLQGRDKAYQLLLARKRASVLRRWLSVVIILALLAIGAALFANEQRKQAVQQALIATSGKLSLSSNNVLKEQPDLALLLAAESYKSFDTYEARFALYSAITHRPNLRLIAHGNRGEITAISRSHDGKIVAAGHKDGSVLFWSVETFESLGPALQAHSATLTSLAFSPTAEVLATAAGDEIRLWDSGTREPLRSPLHTDLGVISKLTFSRDGKRFASAHADGITIWEVESYQPGVHRLKGSEGSSSIAFSPDGAFLAAGDYGGYVRVWNLTDGGRLVGKPIIPWQRFVTSVVFSPDSRLLAIGGSSAGIFLLDPHNEQKVREPLETPGGSTVVVFENTSEQIAAGDSSGIISIWPKVSDLSPLNPPVQRLSGHRGAINALSFDPDGKFLISAGIDGKLIKWSTKETNPLARLVQEGAKSIASAHQSDLMAIGRIDGQILLWDTAGHSPQPRPIQGSGEGIHLIALSHDDKLLAAIDSKKLMVWSLDQRQILTSMPREDLSSVLHLTFTPNGHLVLCSREFKDDDPEKKEWLHVVTVDPSTGQDFGKPQRIPIPFPYVATALSHNGELLALAKENEVLLFQIGKPSIIREPIMVGSKISNLQFSPDQTKIAIRTEAKRIVIWDMSEGKALGELDDSHTSTVHQLAFSPGGRLLASSGSVHLKSGVEGTLIIWDLSTFQQIGQLLQGKQLGQQSLVLAFSPSAKTMVTSCEGVVWSWDINAQSWYSTALRMANRTLSEDEKQRF